MAERLAAGNPALALVGNTAATGAILAVLILILGLTSGARMSSAVSCAMAGRGAIPAREAAAYVVVQALDGVAGTMAAHFVFELPLPQLGGAVRTGFGQWAAEFVASFGLLATILGCLRFALDTVAPAVALYITSASWFTSSTSFADQAVTLAGALSDTLTGIRPVDLPAFWLPQIAGAAAAVVVFEWLLADRRATDPRADGG